MKAKFLITVATLMVMTAPVFASTPTSDPFGATANDQTAQPVPGQYGGDSYGDALVSPFGDRTQLSQSDDLRSTERSRDNLAPPRMDSSGVPDPRV